MFPSALLSGGGWIRLQTMADRLPLAVIDQRFGFEFDLSNDFARADFCVCPVRGSALATHYIGRSAAAPPGSAAAALGACLARNGEDPNSFLASREGDVVLEYDVPDVLPSESAPPGIFLCPASPPEAPSRPRIHDDPSATVGELTSAAAYDVDAEELQEVKRVYKALPDGGFVAQAGMLPGRPQRAVRLVVHGVDSLDVPSLLEQLCWPGSVAAVMSAIEETGGLTQSSLALSLDVTTSGISERLGLELLRPVVGFRFGPAGWGPLIDRLEERAWCVPAKAQALRSLPGSERLIGHGGIYLVYQMINHFKIVVEPSRIGAKAYVAVIVGRL